MAARRVRIHRGDIVRAKDAEGLFTAAVIQADMLAGATVIVCPITWQQIEIAHPLRVPLEGSIARGGEGAQVLADKPITIPRRYIIKVLRSMTFEELHQLESALILVLGMAPLEREVRE